MRGATCFVAIKNKKEIFFLRKHTKMWWNYSKKKKDARDKWTELMCLRACFKKSWLLNALDLQLQCVESKCFVTFIFSQSKCLKDETASKRGDFVEIFLKNKENNWAQKRFSFQGLKQLNHEYIEKKYRK